MTATLPVRPVPARTLVGQPVLEFPDGPGEPWEFTSSDGIDITPAVRASTRRTNGLNVRVRGMDVFLDEATLRAIDELRQALPTGV
ncbi:hypothetical protein GCG21_08840 [Pseudactinotalea sp. HY160]|uniref:hypothetical protein n=1 Tax=Pseudactinotalea sp. HY160 TaxID=2654490 RepID=UPI00128E05D6|nr:hypothetical protein [Pseudactinotalea sp. HY160]MPV50111.1 hypothetical protein [Pseudactinotalea sp. HY160]